MIEINKNELMELNNNDVTATSEELIELSKTLNINDYDSVRTYGYDLQKKSSNESKKLLEQNDTKDVKDIEGKLKKLGETLEKVDPDEVNIEALPFYKKWFTKGKNLLNENVINKYRSISAQINNIESELQDDHKSLMDGVKTLDAVSENSKARIKEYSNLIAAAQLRYDEVNNKMLPELIEVAKETGSITDRTMVNDVTEYTQALESKIHELKQSRFLEYRNVIEIGIIQGNSRKLAENVERSIMTILPVWRTVIVKTIEQVKQKTLIKATSDIKQMTEELLLKNTEDIKNNSISIAEDAEKPFISSDTFAEMHANLVDAVAGTIEAQERGREESRQDAKELEEMMKETNELSFESIKSKLSDNTKAEIKNDKPKAIDQNTAHTYKTSIHVTPDDERATPQSPQNNRAEDILKKYQ